MPRKKQETPAEEPQPEADKAPEPTEEAAPEAQPEPEPEAVVDPPEVKQLAREIYVAKATRGAHGYKPEAMVDRAFELARIWFAATGDK